ncbi:MAG: metalloregulator ArsR/SmtB family transcription factor [Fluviibacter sp.]
MALEKTKEMSSGKLASPVNAAVLDLDWMRHQAGQVVSLLKVIGNPDRLLLLCQMLQGEYSVGELEEMLDIHQPTLSQQLGVLRSEGLVSTRREGKYIYYRVSHPHVQVILETLHQLYCAVPAAAQNKRSLKDAS